MRKELTIEHLAAYLPYGVKMRYIERGKIISTGVIRSIIHNEGDTHPTKVCINYQGDEHIWMFKPLLRPLSQFTKDDLLNMGRTGYDDYIERIKSGRIPYDEMQILLSQHWDVFGLIESGLAEPIPSIEQQ
jgi:hypothetical protein